MCNERFHFVFQLRDRGSLFPYDPVLFDKSFVLLEKLIEQHRIDLFVADRFGLALGIASHQIGIHLRHFLGDQAKGKRLRVIIFFVVAEADRLERIERFAGIVHRLDLVFVPARGYVTAAKSAAAGYGDRIRIGPNNGLRIGVDVADKAAVAHVRAERPDRDNVIGCGNASTRIETQGAVTVTGAVRERIIADSHVAATGGVTNESLKTNRRVAATIGVVHECAVAKCAIGDPIAVGIGESLKTDSRAKTDLLKPRGPVVKL